MDDPFERPPNQLAPTLRTLGIDPEKIEASVLGDLDDDGVYAQVWLAVDQERLAVLVTDAEPQPMGPKISLTPGGRLLQRIQKWLPSKSLSTRDLKDDADRNGKLNVIDQQTIYLKDLEEARVESLVGTGVLVVKAAGEERRLCRFSNSRVRDFQRFAKAVRALAKGKSLQELEQGDDQRDSYCPTCGRPYPESGRKVCPRCMDHRALSRRIFGFFAGRRWELAGILLFMILGASLNLLSPYLSGRVLFDEVLTPGGRFEGRVIEIVLAIASFQLLALFFNIMHQRINAGMTAHVVAGVKTQVYGAMQRLSLGFFTNKQTGGLMTRVNGDAEQLQYFFHDGFPYFVVNSLQLIGIVTAMTLMNWRLTLLLLVPVPAILLLMRYAFPRFWRLFSRRWRAMRSLNSVVNDALTGVRVVKAFGQEDQEIRRFGGRNKTVFDVSLQAGNFSATLFPIMTLLMNAGGWIVWSVGGWDVLDGRITLGTLLTFTMYLGMLYGPLEFMSHIVDWWTACINSASRIFEMLDAVPDVAEKPNAVSLRPIQGEIEVSDVTFSYEPNKPVLKNVSFHVKPGEMIGLVGRSGAGKSTIVNLITRLYDVEEGSIKIDGVDVRDVKIADLRAQIGMVLQDTHLFRGTVAENIAYARPGASQEEIIRAAMLAHAHDFIVKLPDGYETIIGGQGHDLSGGERQRLSIARALLHDPRILILDEATSSVDTETEQFIQAALRRLVQGRTTIAIAHRLSTLREADRLVVIEEGKVVEMGTHAELEAKRGVYYKLRQRQKEALAIRGVAAG